MEKEKILIGSDQWGFRLKNELKDYLSEKGYEVVDVGTTDEAQPVPYYSVAARAARMIQAGEVRRGVLCCGTGMGMAIVANKFKGVYAAVVESEFAAMKSKAINNANLLCMGFEMISFPKAKMGLDSWLSVNHTEGFEGIANFLRQGLVEIAQIEEENFR